MIEIEIDLESLDRARKKADEMGKIKGSIIFGTGNLAGFVGEEITKKFLNSLNLEVIEENTYDYDLIVNEIKIDVKTKQTSVVPLLTYSASVAAFNYKQKTDLYLFTRVHKNFTKGWIMGFIPKAAFFEKAIKYKKGDYDPDNKFYFKSDCSNLYYSDLIEPQEIVKYLEK